MTGLLYGQSPPGDNAKRIQNIVIDDTAPTNDQVMYYDLVSGKIKWADIPSLIGTPLIYKGLWDASANTPSLADGTGTSGWTYVVSVDGTQDLGSGSQDFTANDLVLYNGTTWEKVEHDAYSTTNVYAEGVRPAGTGNITLSSASDADIDATYLVASVPAVVGDVIAVTFTANAICASGSDARIDALITSGSSAKYVGSRTTNRGNAWVVPNPNVAGGLANFRVSGTVYWTVTANDLTTSTFSVKMRYRGTGGAAAVLVNSADYPIIVSVLNLGQ